MGIQALRHICGAGVSLQHSMGEQGLSTPSHQEPATTLTVAHCYSGFYKLSSKYL